MKRLIILFLIIMNIFIFSFAYSTDSIIHQEAEVIALINSKNTTYSNTKVLKVLLGSQKGTLDIEVPAILKKGQEFQISAKITNEGNKSLLKTKLDSYLTPLNKEGVIFYVNLPKGLKIKGIEDSLNKDNIVYKTYDSQLFSDDLTSINKDNIEKIGYILDSVDSGVTLDLNLKLVVTDEFKGGNFESKIIYKGLDGQDKEENSKLYPVKLEEDLNTTKLYITKIVNKKTIGIGELLKYTIELGNNSDENISNIKVYDNLPRGFDLKGYQKEEGNLEIENWNGREFELSGSLPSKEKFSFSYIVRVNNSSRMGENINSAKADGRNNRYYDSNTASIGVEVEDDLFDQKGIIFGRVYIDENKNKKVDKNEVGIPGAKIYLENGNYVITDSQGMYSLYGQRSITHGVKIDRTSLPEGLAFLKLGNKYSSKGDFAFADLKTGQLLKVNFAAIDVSQEVYNEILKRKERFGKESELLSSFDKDTKFKSEEIKKNATVDPEGVISNYNNSDSFNENKEFNEEPSFSSNIEKKDLNLDLKSKISKINDNSLEIMNYKDGDTVRKNIRLKVKGSSQTTLDLLINNKIISKEKLKVEGIDAKKNLSYKEYYGLNLELGLNKISLIQRDFIGRVQSEKSIELYVPDLGEEIVFTTKSALRAGNKELDFLVEIKDKNNINVVEDIPITIEVDSGKIIDSYTGKEEILFKTITNKGKVEFKYVSPSKAAEVILKLKANGVEKDFKLEILPPKEPLMITGIIEGRYDAFRGNSNQSQENYLFEDNLSNFDGTNNRTASYRNSVFAKGTVYDDYYLTLSYDDNKNTDELFKDIEPDKYYPIYGDSSIRGYEAQSTSDLYLRIDKNKTTILYGDYNTDWYDDDLVKLGYLNRTFNGAYSKFEGKKLKTYTFVSDTDYIKKTEEIRGRGISGPYYVDGDIVEGSDKVSIITRDRNMSSIILSEEPQSRNSDYIIDYNTGGIYFNEPVSSTDNNLDHVYIRVEYEVNGDSEKYIVWGNYSEMQATDKLLLGWSYLTDDNPEGEDSKSVFVKYEFNEYLKVITEYVNASKDAYRIDMTYEKGNNKLHLEYFNTDNNFENSSSKFSEGLEGIRIRYSKKLSESDTFTFENKYEENNLSHMKTNETKLEVIKKYNENISLGSNVKYTYEDDGDADDDSLSIGGVAKVRSQKIKRLTYIGEYDQDIKELERRRLMIGTDYAIRPDTDLYVRQELFSTYEDSSVLKDSGDSTTIVGVKTRVFEKTTIYSEYSVEDATSEKESKASFGVKRDIEITEDLSGGVSFERIHPINYTGDTKEEVTSVTVSYKWDISPKEKSTGNIETSKGSDKDVYSNKFAYIKKINKDSSIILKERYVYERYSDDAKDIKGRVILGYAFRDYEEDKSNKLIKYEVNYEDDDSEDYSHLAHIVNLTANLQINEDIVYAYVITGKYVDEELDYISSDYLAYMLGNSFSVNITDKYDFNINTALYGDDDFEEYSYAVGFELGYKATDHLWLSSGYNIVGFKDNDFDNEGYYRQGIYIRFRMSLSEDLFWKI